MVQFELYGRILLPQVAPAEGLERRVNAAAARSTAALALLQAAFRSHTASPATTSALPKAAAFPTLRPHEAGPNTSWDTHELQQKIAG